MRNFVIIAVGFCLLNAVVAPNILITGQDERKLTKKERKIQKQTLKVREAVFDKGTGEKARSRSL